jgi:hypothetical protein
MHPSEQRWLEEALEGLARAVAYPSPPDLAATVRTRLGRRRRAARHPWLLRGAVAAALAIVAIVVAVVTVEDARDVVADFFGFGVAGERIEISRDTPTPSATPLPRLEGVVEETTLAAAADRLGFEPRVPPGARVERVYLLELFGLRGVVLRTPDYDLWQFANDGGVFLAKRGFYGSTAVQELTLDGQPAYWVTGGPRVLAVRDTSGREVTGISTVTDGHALLFARGDTTFRIEGDLALEEALAIAASID